MAAIGPTQEEKKAQRVFDLVRRKPGIKRGQIMASLRLSAKEVNAVHATLTQREWIIAKQEGKGTAYYANESAEPSLETP